MKNALQHRKGTIPQKKSKPFIGKYVCYGEEDGSFSFGRIVDEGIVNSPHGEKEVFILENRTTCRVPKSDLELQSVQAISNAIGPGGSRHFLPPVPGPTESGLLPDKFDDPKITTNRHCMKLARAPELDGIVPDLGVMMGWDRSKMGDGLPMSEMVKTIKSSADPNRTITFLIRNYGYRTNVRKDRINIASMQDGGDIVDKHSLGLDSLTDDELFLCVMGRQSEGLPLNQGMRNILQASSVMEGGTDTAEKLPEVIVELATKELKGRLSDDTDVIDVDVVEVGDTSDPENNVFRGLPVVGVYGSSRGW